MKTLLTLVAITLPLFAMANDLSEDLQRTLTIEAVNDIAGKNSLFGGAVKAHHDEMEETYGGRFSADSLEVAVTNVSYTTYRHEAKYCDGYADKNGKLLPEDTEYEDPRAVYRICDRTDTGTYVVTVTFQASSSGTAEKEGQVFKVTRNDNYHLVVKKDAGYSPDPEDIKERSETVDYVVTKLAL